MSQRERSSLTAAFTKRPLVKAEERGPAALAESLLLGSQPPVEPAIEPNIEPPIQPIVLPPSLLKRKQKKRPRIAWTFKIDPALHEELSAVADFNEIPMAEIVNEAITLHLKNFPHPAPGEGKGRR